MVDRPEVVGVAEIAELLGVSRQRVHQLVHEHTDFPSPLAELGAGRQKMKVWLRAEVEVWARRTGRLR